MNEQHGYRRHVIDWELIEIKPGRYRWLFFIDGEYLATSTDALTCLETARDDALLLAALRFRASIYGPVRRRYRPSGALQCGRC